MTSATVADAPAEVQSESRFAYQPALDGLRALAVFAVLLYHQFTTQWASGGFLGVDVFFVLSGYLITSILLTEYGRARQVDVVRFWGRRARRLLPALGIMLLIVAGYAAFAASPFQLDRIRSDSFATMFYYENYWQASRPFLALPLGHTWSLSIEEQFYVVWPLLLVGLLSITHRRWRPLLGAIAILATASALWMALAYRPSNVGSLYVETQMRGHELLIGAVLAVLLARGWHPSSRGARGALELAGMAGVVAFAGLIYATTLTSAWLYRGGYALIALGAAVVIAAAVQPASPVLGRALSLRPVVAIGIVSYGVYLFHEPIYFILGPERVHLSGLPLFAVRVAVTLAIATASYLLVERPIRTSSMSLQRFGAFAVSGAAVLVVVILVSTRGAIPITPSSSEGSTFKQLAAAAPPGSTKVLLVGDTLATSMRAIGSTYTGAGIFGALDYDWCHFQASEVALGPVLVKSPPCGAPAIGLQTAVGAFRPEVTVLMIGSQEVLDRVDDGQRLPVGAPQTAVFLARQLEHVRQILTANGAPMLLTTVPCLRLPALATRGPADQARRVDWVNAQLRLFASAHRDTVRIIDFGDFLCDHSGRRVVDGQSWGDASGVGLSAAGASATWEWLARFAQNARKGLPAPTP